MENLMVFILIIIGVVTPITILVFKILFKNSITFYIGVIVAILLDVISILSFVNGAGEDIGTMAWMGPLGIAIIIFGFYLIHKALKNIESFAAGNFSTVIDSKTLSRNDENR